LLTLHRNNGKGGAVRKGMVRARGRYLLMADADGATKASDLERLLVALRGIERDGLGIAVGSRAHLEDADSDAKARRTPLRRFLMWGFHTLITLMLGSSEIADTQCGFKLFTRRSAGLMFPVQHIDRWAFDVELLYLAGHHRIPLVVSGWAGAGCVGRGRSSSAS
jgi:dolichyl-phosphate beta-glucosyltransferase